MADRRNWPFLSILAWPEGWDRDRVADLLTRAGGLDVATLRLRLARPPPLVLDQVEPAAAAAVIEALLGAGGDGFAFTLADLAAPGPALLVRDLGVVEGALQLQPQEGRATALPFNAVQVIVRAHLSQVVTRRHQPPILSSLVGRFRTWDGIKAEIESQTFKDVATSDKLDLHTVSGPIYRIDADRFGFAVLGELRGHGDKANMDRLLELLGRLCPDAVIDVYFKLWRPPPGCDRLRLPGPRLKAVDPAFEFYSRWAAIAWRRAMTP